MEMPSVSFTALLLAGRRGLIDPIARSVGGSHKVLVPVAGVPMILRVTRTLRTAQMIGQIVVCTDDPSAFRELDELHAGDISFYTSSGRAPSESVLQYFAGQQQTTPLLVVTADHPLLTVEMVDYFCSASAKSGADVAVGLVAESTFRTQYPHSRRSFIPLRDESFCGTNLFALLTPQAAAAARFWNHAGQFRKRPWRLIRTFGWMTLLLLALRRIDLIAAVSRASRIIGAQVAAVQMPFPESAIDVDTLDDLATVTQILTART